MIGKLVSTIIPVFNRADMLRCAVRSVLDQTYPDHEIIIVDDGSTDSTAETADTMARPRPDQIRVLHVANGGPGSAREHGRVAARGDFIQYLDSDDRLLPCKFEIQVAALQAHPECGAAYGKTRLIDANGQILKAPYKWSGRAFTHLFPALLVDRWWNTHTPLYRRSVCDAVGPWTNMRMGEDWQYDARVGALRTQLAFCDEYVSEHRHHDEPRLTGGQAPSLSALKDFGRLIPALHQCAVKAGVNSEAEEMRHFSRWAFAVARQLGKAGVTGSAQECFEIARLAAGPRGNRWDFRLYGCVSRLLGWRLSGNAAHWLDRALKRQPSRHTLKQSWMKS